MSTQSDLSSIKDMLIKLDTNRVDRLSYTQNAFDNDLVDGVTTFDVNAEQNIPAAGYADYNPTVLNKGLRSQGASIPRNSLNHFYGRLSYNVNKLIQKLRAFIIVDIASKAHNANEYDASAPYASGDVCYMMEAQGLIRSYILYQRTSSAPATISGIAVTDTNHWTKVQPKVKGIHKDYQIADLTALSTSTWYPVVTTLQDFQADTVGTKDGATRIRIEAYMNGTIALLPQSVRTDLVVDSKFTGFAASSTDIVEDMSCIGQTDGFDFSAAANNPIGYSKLPLGRQAVIWLRGGAKYAIWNSFGSAFTLYTGSYNNGLDGAISPSASRVFSVNNARLLADVDTVDGLQGAAIFAYKGVSLIGLDCNSMTENGTWHGAFSANSPLNGQYGMLSVMFAGDICFQFYHISNNDPAGQTFMRTYHTGVWSPWGVIWNSANDGLGSGLDADIVRGHFAALTGNMGESLGTGQTITTAEFVALLASRGAFTEPCYIIQGMWYFQGNVSISEIGVSTAGCIIRVTTASATQYTIELINPITSAYFIYAKREGSAGWMKMWHDLNDGPGSGLDADLWDSLERPLNFGTNSGSGVYTAKDVINTLFKVGAVDYFSPGSVNTPFGGYWQISCIAGGDTNTAILLLATQAGGGAMFIGVYLSGTLHWSPIWNGVNDGVGSGLDADTVDGLHAVRFLQNNGAGGSQDITGQNINTTILPTNFYCGRELVGAPTAEWYHLEVMNYGGGGISNAWTRQVIHAYGALSLDNYTNSWTRVKQGEDVWTPWLRMWNSGNDGPGSGLDADTLDGKDSYVISSEVTFSLHGSSTEGAIATAIGNASQLRRYSYCHASGQLTAQGSTITLSYIYIEFGYVNFYGMVNGAPLMLTLLNSSAAAAAISIAI